jgi:plasmid stabilization system protein ParE
MKVALAPEAAERLEAQIAYLREVGAEAAAERLRARVLSFLLNHVARFSTLRSSPRGARSLEMWIPRTRLVLWYRIEADRIEIATVWHTSQERRSTAKP